MMKVRENGRWRDLSALEEYREYTRLNTLLNQVMREMRPDTDKRDTIESATV